LEHVIGPRDAWNVRGPGSLEVCPMTTDQTNAREYVSEAMRGPVDDRRDLLTLADGGDPDYTVPDERVAALGIDPGDYVGDQALESLHAYPLAVEVMTTFEIVLGVGGPDSRILVECDRGDSHDGMPG